MKTYEQYLKIITDREQEKAKKEYDEHLKWCDAHPGDGTKFCLYLSTGNVGKMTFDYSVEIMGMMMKDFLKEWKQK